MKAGVRRAVVAAAAGRLSSLIRFGSRDRLAVWYGVEVHFNRPRSFPVEDHPLTRVQPELVLDKLVRREEELNGVDLVRRRRWRQRTARLGCDWRGGSPPAPPGPRRPRRWRPP